MCNNLPVFVLRSQVWYRCRFFLFVLITCKFVWTNFDYFDCRSYRGFVFEPWLDDDIIRYVLVERGEKGIEFGQICFACFYPDFHHMFSILPANSFSIHHWSYCSQMSNEFRSGFVSLFVRHCCCCQDNCGRGSLVLLGCSCRLLCWLGLISKLKL